MLIWNALRLATMRFEDGHIAHCGAYIGAADAQRGDYVHRRLYFQFDTRDEAIGLAVIHGHSIVLFAIVSASVIRTRLDFERTDL